MLKKIGLSLLTVFMFGALAFAGNADSEEDRYNREGIWDTSLSTYVFRVSSGGHISNHLRTGELGSPTANWKKLYLADNGIITSTGIVRHNELFLDLPAKSQSAVLAAAAVSTTTLATGGTTYGPVDFLQPSVPRNIVILATAASLVGQSTIAITGVNHCFVQGINSVGVSTREYVTLVSTTDAAVGRGNVAWAYISSVTITGVTFNGLPEPTLKIFIGTSDKIGLVNDLENTSDVYHLNEGGNAISSATISAVYNTTTFTTTPNGALDYVVRYIQKFFTPLP